MASKYFGESVMRVLFQEYPEHAWKVWEFNKVPKSSWKLIGSAFRQGDIIGETVIRIYLNDLEVKHHIKSVEDWKRLALKKQTATDSIRNRQLGPLVDLLPRLYKEVPHWNSNVRESPEVAPGAKHKPQCLVKPNTLAHRARAQLVQCGSSLEICARTSPY